MRVATGSSRARIAPTRPRHLITRDRVREAPERLARRLAAMPRPALAPAPSLAARAISMSGMAAPWEPLKIETAGAFFERKQIEVCQIIGMDRR